ncbi:MAG: hypothetical protein ACXAEU_12695 [Candidatus Hodarchaeales archaeon]
MSKNPLVMSRLTRTTVFINDYGCWQLSIAVPIVPVLHQSLERCYLENQAAR